MNLIVPKSTGRRGSLKLTTPASTFRNIMKHSVYQIFNIDVQGQVSEVSLSYSYTNSQC